MMYGACPCSGRVVSDWTWNRPFGTVTSDFVHVTLARMLTGLSLSQTKPKSLRPSNSHPTIDPFSPLMKESSGVEPVVMTAASIGLLMSLVNALSDTSSRGEKNHSHRASQLSTSDCTRFGFPCSGRRL